MKIKTLLIIPMAMGLSACGTFNEPTLKPIPVSEVAKVQNDIRDQVGAYMAKVMYDRETTTRAGGSKKHRLRAPPQDIKDTCPGTVDFDIKSIKVKLTTSDEVAFDAGVALTLKGAKGDTGYDKSSDKSATGELDYTVFPIPTEYQDTRNLRARYPAPVDIGKRPLAQALVNLREGLTKTAQEAPCFSDYTLSDPTQDAGHSFVLGLTDNGDSKASLGILFFSASDEDKSGSGQSITVSFAQTGLDDITAIKAMVDSVCAPKNDTIYPMKEADRETVYKACDAAEEYYYGKASWQAVEGVVKPGLVLVQEVLPRQLPDHNTDGHLLVAQKFPAVASIQFGDMNFVSLDEVKTLSVQLAPPPEPDVAATNPSQGPAHTQTPPPGNTTEKVTGGHHHHHRRRR
jgi:hypothetical protein